jgi:hypothetical protein
MVSKKATELSNQLFQQSTCCRTLSIRRHPQPREPVSKALKKSKNSYILKQKRHVSAILKPSALSLAFVALDSVIDISINKTNREDRKDKENEENKLRNDNNINKEK